MLRPGKTAASLKPEAVRPRTGHWNPLPVAAGGLGTSVGEAGGAAVVSLAGGWPDRVGVVVSTPFDDGDVTPSALRLTGTVRSLPASGSTRLWPTWMV